MFSLSNKWVRWWRRFKGERTFIKTDEKGTKSFISVMGNEGFIPWLIDNNWVEEQ